MKTSIITKVFVWIIAAFVAQDVCAQDKPDIINNINAAGNVTVSVPEGLATRNNSDIGKKPATVTSEKTGTSSTRTTASTTTTVNTNKKSNNSTVNKNVSGHQVGYRIQVFNDNSANAKANAQACARACAMKFPQYRAYISYNAPAWRLRIGDFRDVSEANAALARVRAGAPAHSSNIMLVKDNINVWSK